ncbi:MAG: hypothetical protein ACXVHX_17120 [Solirubrobacteraceae bacterium]
MWITPDKSSTYAFAEFLEGELLVSGDRRLTVAEIRDLFISTDVPSEDELDYALIEIEDRSARWGSHYPYSRDGDAVVIREGGSELYAALLLLSLRKTPYRDDREFRRSDDVLDLIAREAARAALGPGSDALIFGSPAREGRPQLFPDAVAWLAERVGISLRSSEAYSDAADGGVDVVAWRRFPDYEVGFPFLIVQNTVQVDFKKKARDAVPGDWREWLRLKAEPTVGFAVPFAMANNDPWWMRVASGVTYMWDRRRLTWELRNCDPCEWPDWQTITTFVRDEVARIRDGIGVRGDVARPVVVRGRKPQTAASILGSNPAL